MSKFFYAVKIGRNPGIFKTWDECEIEVKGFKGAKYKKFKLYEDAMDFIEGKEIKLIKKKMEKEIEDIKTIEEVADKDEMIAYVDGSFSLESMTYSYGVVAITQTGIETFKGIDRDPELAKMRNVSGELKGATVAMDIAIKRGYKKLSLHFDYAGIEKWAIGEWKTNKLGTKNYKDYIDSIKDKLDIKFIKVKAHTGVEYNELADELARQAIIENTI